MGVLEDINAAVAKSQEFAAQEYVAKEKALKEGIPLKQYFEEANKRAAIFEGIRIKEFEKQNEALIHRQEAEVLGLPLDYYLMETCQQEGDINIFGKFCSHKDDLAVFGILVMFIVVFALIGWNVFFNPEQAKKAKNCPNCNNGLQPRDTFCSKCGHKVGTKISSQPLLDNKSPMKSKTTHLSVIEYASFGRRLVAHLIDMSLNWLIIPLFINIHSYYKHNQTLGDKVMGIQVFNDDTKHPTPTGGQLTGRYLAKIVSFLTLGIGFLMIIFTEKKKGLHDKLADTVIRQVGVAHWGGAFVIIVVCTILWVAVDIASTY